MSEWVHVRRQQDNVWKLPSERVDVLTRFLTRDGRETGRTQRSQDEEEEPYTMKTKTSTWKHEEVPDLLVMRADAVWTSCEQQHWSVHSRVYTSCPASCCSTGPAPAALQAPPLAWMFPHVPVWTSRTDNLLLLHKLTTGNVRTLFYTVHVWKTVYDWADRFDDIWKLLYVWNKIDKLKKKMKKLGNVSVKKSRIIILCGTTHEPTALTCC